MLSMIHVLAWAPFLDPIPIWGDRVWPWMLLPLTAGVSIVYKSVKCRRMSQVPKEAAEIFITILIGMVAAAALLAGIVEVREWMEK